MARAYDICEPLRLALIGMSGAGKTFWTKKLADAGRPTLCCDESIEQELSEQLERGGYRGIHGVAAWMGWPNSPTYGEREAEYLSAEMRTLSKALDCLEEKPHEPLILDTTGSVIYTGNHLLMRLRQVMTVVYLEVGAADEQLLVARYLQDPKPVLWRGVFRPRAGEQPEQTVARCYPLLIAARRQSYQALAHCTLPVAELRHGPEEANIFLQRVQGRIARSGSRELR